MKNSLYEKLYSKLANDIRTGILSPGTKLPSVRKYADEQGISRNTVIGAYNLLLAEGYIQAREKSGYYVARFEQSLPRPERQKPTVKSPEAVSEKPKAIDLSSNMVDSSLFPYSTLRQLYRETLSDSNRSLLEQAGNFKGEQNLRQSIADFVYNHKGIVCSAEQVIIGNGTSSHLQVLPKLFGGHPLFLMEEPGFGISSDMIEEAGSQVLHIPVDEEGASIGSIREKTRDISERPVILHVSPSHQFPLGTTMTAPRRSSLLKWMDQSQNRYIVEDDYDSDFRYNGHPIPSLQSMDNTGRVIYMGTFSRTLTPSMRISYMILPQNLLDSYSERFGSHPCPVSRIDQNVISLFMDNGYFERHISRMRRIYRAKRNSILQTLRAACPQIQIRGEEAGLHFIARFPLPEKEMIEQARRNGFILNGTGTGWIVIGYAHLSEQEEKAFGRFIASLTHID